MKKYLKIALLVVVAACVGSVVGASVEPVNAIPLDTST